MSIMIFSPVYFFSEHPLVIYFKMGHIFSRMCHFVICSYMTKLKFEVQNFQTQKIIIIFKSYLFLLVQYSISGLIIQFHASHKSFSACAFSKKLLAVAPLFLLKSSIVSSIQLLQSSL